jgi:hypothetical protein
MVKPDEEQHRKREIALILPPSETLKKEKSTRIPPSEQERGTPLFPLYLFEV